MRRFLVFALLIPGCAAAPLAMLSTAVGIAGTAVSTGADVYSQGKLDSAEMASLDQIRNAVFLAADDLRLTTEFEHVGPTPDKPARLIRFADDRKTEVDITIDPRAANLTRLRINVGIRGDEPTARLILKQVRTHLPTHAVEAPEEDH